MKRNDIFSCESVTSGHPDKLCDAISDAILDSYIEKDPLSRVACECMASAGQVMISGQITSNGIVNLEETARNVVRNIGYDSDKKYFNADTCAINISVNKQSPDIAMGVDVNGAGDQGMMFGYANNETKNYLPFAFSKAHELCKTLETVRKEKNDDVLYPDGKAQISVQYEDNKIKRIDTILVSSQHNNYIALEDLKTYIKENVIFKVFQNSDLIDDKTKILINPTGRFNIGGPLGDTGLTGRKIIVDTYGGYAPHGGGAFSGKDPTKVDRSAAYMARYIAKNIVHHYGFNECTVQLAYAIGVPQPVSISININDDKVKDSDIKDITKIIKNKLDLSPKGIIDFLDLRRPIYLNNVNYGHFGKDAQIYKWEELNLF